MYKHQIHADVCIFRQFMRTFGWKICHIRQYETIVKYFIDNTMNQTFHFKRFILSAMLTFIGLALSGCSLIFYPADKPESKIYEPLEYYKYFYIEKSDVLVSAKFDKDDDGETDSYKTSINTSDLISGYMMREGFIRLNELSPDLANNTLIISYGESDSYNNSAFKDARIVTLQFLRADTSSLVATCSAEGNGGTYVDDLRDAINTCFKTLFPRKKK